MRSKAQEELSAKQKELVRTFSPLSPLPFVLSPRLSLTTSGLHRTRLKGSTPSSRRSSKRRRFVSSGGSDVCFCLLHSLTRCLVIDDLRARPDRRMAAALVMTDAGRRTVTPNRPSAAMPSHSRDLGGPKTRLSTREVEEE